MIWLDLVTSVTVVLSEQRLYATTESGQELSFVVSTGAEATPTPVMSTEIERKYEEATLIGPGYAIQGVPWIMCPKDNPAYCIHPNLSNNPLGEPHSLGCVRLSYKDAEELFNLVEEGTPFIVVDEITRETGGAEPDWVEPGGDLQEGWLS